jgi:hypothetical protein
MIDVGANILTLRFKYSKQTYTHAYMLILRHIKLIAFELAGEDRDRRQNPVLTHLKIAFFALHKRG